jgi:hypothetical protein
MKLLNPALEKTIDASQNDSGKAGKSELKP